MSKTVTHEEKLKKLREIVKAVDICMLTTTDERGEPHSSRCPIIGRLSLMAISGSTLMALRTSSTK